MTFLGKIFSALIFVLSMSFLLLAIMVTATHKNWRDAAINPSTGLKQMVEAKERGIKQLQESLTRAEVALAHERAARRTALAALQTEAAELRSNLQNAVSEVQTLEGLKTALTQEVNTQTQELTRLTSENAGLRTQIRKEREDRDQLFYTAARVSDELNATKGVVSEMQERNTQLIAQNTRYKEVLTASDINPEDPIDNAPPKRNGVVLLVSQPSRLVQVSIGYDEGLREGHFLEVTRGGKYLGRLRVRKTEPNQSVAEILPELQSGIMKEGDRVDTSIK
ncbi:Chromosome partition protein Smc [Rosistilla oblonga]|uniref:Chromosome partition protein Smc n=1 Tax=Rosistilla oblonga TaxID=2527990 RepID=A0A518IVD1_9BACT|nr:hypothetical protein [Rosistilla oblonga]QDV14805.1 Chromosome partition protein Smc [Rosistilla oblonga]QDV57044.1 Chromosome partition protein Smc [Rosistilla oblonga]|eukprot:TRINITY_DN70806_c0_g1_i1.p1 TRINITY_DN70806_c0_g1~~TRINITY_DN70806_c0_g1_i1.p1  ORF type:complete len:280 (-),score=38.93 TRINITY_DN70806_c0_g1_i1:185-1024(-)